MASLYRRETCWSYATNSWTATQQYFHWFCSSNCVLSIHLRSVTLLTEITFSWKCLILWRQRFFLPGLGDSFGGWTVHYCVWRAIYGHIPNFGSRMGLTCANQWVHPLSHIPKMHLNPEPLTKFNQSSCLHWPHNCEDEPSLTNRNHKKLLLQLSATSSSFSYYKLQDLHTAE